MTLTRAALVSGALVWATTGLATWAWFTLPDGAGVPFHALGLDGVRRTGLSREALWILPIAGPFAWAVMVFAPRFVAQKVEALAPELYDTVLVGVAGLLLAVQAALVVSAFDGGFDPLRPIALAVGVLLIAVGNYLGKARRNTLIGIRTPWTLADARVWDQTHRLGGRLMMLGGVALVGAVLVLRDPLALAAAMAVCASVPMAVATAWSWRLHRQA